MAVSGTPLGMAGSSVTTLVLSIYNTGIAVGSWAPVNLVLGLAVFYGGLGNLIAGVWEHKAGNAFGATVFTSYGACWLSYAVILIPGFGVFEAFQDHPDVVGNAIAIFILGWAIFTFLVFLCTLRQSRVSYCSSPCWTSHLCFLHLPITSNRMQNLSQRLPDTQAFSHL